MSENDCRFCGATGADRYPGGEFAVCRECAAGIRELLLGDADSQEEVVGYDYTLSEGEVMYLATREQFFEIEIRSETNSKMIYLQPLARNEPPVPITTIDEEIGNAIGEGLFYRVSIDTVQLQEHETWWHSALALAPEPPTPDTGPNPDTDMSATTESDADSERSTDTSADAFGANPSDDTELQFSCRGRKQPYLI